MKLILPICLEQSAGLRDLGPDLATQFCDLGYGTSPCWTSVYLSQGTRGMYLKEALLWPQVIIPWSLIYVKIKSNLFVAKATEARTPPLSPSPLLHAWLYYFWLCAIKCPIPATTVGLRQLLSPPDHHHLLLVSSESVILSWTLGSPPPSLQVTLLSECLSSQLYQQQGVISADHADAEDRNLKSTFLSWKKGRI